MKLDCCERCQIFWTCETKWYRGERQEENICCQECDYYRECLIRAKKTNPRIYKPVRKRKTAI